MYFFPFLPYMQKYLSKSTEKHTFLKVYKFFYLQKNRSTKYKKKIWKKLLLYIRFSWYLFNEATKKKKKWEFWLWVEQRLGKIFFSTMRLHLLTMKQTVQKLWYENVLLNNIHIIRVETILAWIPSWNFV